MCISTSARPRESAGTKDWFGHRLQIGEDCSRLEKHESIFFKRRDAAVGVKFEIRLFSMFPCRHVDDDELMRDLFLSESYEHPA
jgi:hypothetical protein